MSGRVAVLGLLLAATVLALLGSGAAAQEFPHLDHEGLFPVCQGCHAGIEDGSVAEYYPEPDSCRACHDGTRRATVEWSGPSRPVRFLEFTHLQHAEDVNDAGDADLACSTCHEDPGATGRMAVAPARPDTCVGCHAHAVGAHPTPEQDCRACHRAVARSLEIPASRIRAFPLPDTHVESAFLLQHAPTSERDEARCATCHSRESCTRCHLDGNSRPSIAALEEDSRIAAWVAELEPEYPAPGSHGEAQWRWSHGARIEEGACASCHTRDSCTTCHANEAVVEITRLPVRPRGDPRGVRLPARTAESVHPFGFETRHGALAAGPDRSCESCHTSALCESCHAGPDRPVFHAENFLARHGPDAYAARTECAACHDAAVFCRSCHQDLGLAGSGRLGTGFHTSRPLWLFGHGVAARQGLDGCTTCHAQDSCARCHSEFGGWGINPHGPDFDPERAREVNPFSCARCHAGGGGG